MKIAKKDKMLNAWKITLVVFFVAKAVLEWSLSGLKKASGDFLADDEFLWRPFVCENLGPERRLSNNFQAQSSFREAGIALFIFAKSF